MDLQQRVERLERENRRLKLVGVGALVLVALATMGQFGINYPPPAYGQQPGVAKFDQIEARGIYIVSQNGTRIASFADAGDSTGYLLVKDSNGKYGVEVGVQQGGNGSISLFKGGTLAQQIKP